MFTLPRICTSDPNSTPLSDVYRLFSAIVFLAIQVACFKAILDCITKMIGRFFICILSSRRHVTKDAEDGVSLSLF